MPFHPLFAALIGSVAALFFTVPASGESAPLLPRTGLTERVTLDAHSGIAIHGYDPVSYLTEPGPMIGRAAHEVEWSGSVWRFASAANRAIFLDDPERYAPRLGGYDPVAVMDGRTAAGNPLIYRLREDGLYLFTTPQNRAAFTAAYEFHAMQNAWAALRTRLAP